MKENTSEIINKLFNKTLLPLPGIKSHVFMRPIQRSEFTIPYMNDSRESAVLVLLFVEKNDELCLLLIKRNEYSGIHSGQISFPGGSFEPNDKTFFSTAKREAFEETGINPMDVHLIGLLTAVHIPVSNFNLHPYLAYCLKRPNFMADPYEVSQIIKIPIKQLLRTQLSIKQMNIGKLTSDVPGFEIENVFIWGATAMIVNELKLLLT